MTGTEKDAALISALTDHAGLTVTEVAKKAKVDPETLRKPLMGKTATRLSQRTLEKLRETYPQFPGWPAYMGVDSLSESRVPYRSDDTSVAPSKSRKPDADADTVELEQIDLKFGLGGTYTDSMVEVAKRPFSRAWLQAITSTAPRHLFWAVGDGDSMEPTIRSGEVLLIDRSEFSPRFDDSIWALVHGEIGMIKRLRMLPGGAVELHSDNQLVRPQVAVDGELHVIGRVIAVVRRL